MNTFDDLVGRVSVGVSTRPLDATTLPDALRHTVPPCADPALTALDAAAAFAAVRASVVDRGEPGEPVDLPPLGGRRASPGVEAVLTRLSGETMATSPTDRAIRAALDELADHRQMVGERLQLRLLPRLVRLPDPLSGVVSERILALAEVFPGLKRLLRRAGSASSDATVKASPKGSAAQKAAHLRDLRGTDPGAGRELLERWLPEHAYYGDRRRFVECLEVNLSMDDEPILEQVLQDDADVSSAAAGLLRRLPQSRLMSRVLAAAAGAVEHRAGAAGQPASTHYTAVARRRPMVRDLGLESGTPATSELQTTGQLIAAVPTHRWVELVGAPAVDIIAAAPPAEAEQVASGWAGAAAASNDVELARWLARRTTNLKDLGRLAPLLPQADAESLALTLLTDHAQEAIFGVLRPRFPSAVPEPVLRQLLDLLPKWAAEPRPQVVEWTLDYLEVAATPGQLGAVVAAAHEAARQSPETDAHRRRVVSAAAGRLQLRAALADAVAASVREGGVPWASAAESATPPIDTLSPPTEKEL